MFCPHFSGTSYRLIAVLFAAIFIRATIPLYVLFTSGDLTIFYEAYSIDFEKLAENLVATWNYGYNSVPELYYVPGYPIFLLILRSISDSPFVIIILQIALSTLTTPLVYRSVKLLSPSESAALTAAILYAFEPLSVIFSSLVMPETAFTFFIMLSIYLLLKFVNSPTPSGDAPVEIETKPLSEKSHIAEAASPSSQCSSLNYNRAQKSHSMRYIALSAVIMGLAAYFSPINYGLIFLVPVIILITAKDQWVAALIYFVVGIIIVGLWQVRNYEVSGHWFFSTGVYNRLAEEDNAVAKEVGSGVLPYETGSNYLDDPLRSSSEHLDLKKTLLVLVSHPIQVAIITMKSLIRTMTGLEIHSYVRVLNLSKAVPGFEERLAKGESLMSVFIKNPDRRAMPLFLIVFLAGAVTALIYIGAILSVYRLGVCNRNILILIFVIAYFLAAAAGVWGYSRFRHPIMPMLCILAGIGLPISARTTRRL